VDNTRSRFGFITIAAAFATLLVISYFGYQDWRQYDASLASASDSRQIQVFNGAVLDRLRDAETSQRGFLLTQKLEYLKTYTAALNQLPADMGELEKLVGRQSDQHERVGRLQSLIAVKLAELQKTIELSRSQGSAAALALVKTDQGQRAMDDIRRVSQEIENAENARRLAARSEFRAKAQRVRFVTLTGAFVLAMLVGIGGAALRSADRQLRQLIAQLDDSKRSVEQARDLLKTTLYSIGDGVITTDRGGAVQIMNTVAERLTGYTEQEACGQNVERVFHIVNESTRNTVENPIRRVLQDGQIVGLANHTLLFQGRAGRFPSTTAAHPS